MNNIEWGFEEEPKNELSTINVAKELISLEDILATDLFTESKIESVLKEIESKVAGITGDISTDKGRKQLASVAYKVTRSKTAIDKIGKELTEDWNKKLGEINALRKRARDNLDALAEKIRKPVTDWENADKKRISDREGRIKQINDLVSSPIMRKETLSNIQSALHKLAEFDWQEFQEKAHETIIRVENVLNDRFAELDKLEQAEKIREELLKREAEDRGREQARKEAEQKIKEAEQKAEKEMQGRQEAENRAQEAERIAQMRAEQQAKEKKLSEEFEKKKRETNDDHRKLINNEILNAMIAIAGENQDKQKLRDIIIAIINKKIPHITINY